MFQMVRLLVAALLVAAAAAVPALADNVRKPLGLYLQYDVVYALQKAHLETASEAQKVAYVKSDLAKLLASPILSGIAIGGHWDDLQPNQPAAGDTACKSCDWGYLDDAVEVAKAAGKTVQFNLTPGFDSPEWEKKKLTACDTLFNASKTADPDCGSVEFANFPEEFRVKPDPGTKVYTLPLPWSSTYQEDWGNFLEAVAEHFKGDKTLVAIELTGPIGGSNEMILPTTSSKSTTQVGGVDADDAWSALIANYDKDTKHPNYDPKSDQILIDAWVASIKQSEQIFSGLTLSLSPDTGNALPTFGSKSATTHPDDAALDGVDCGDVPPEMKLSCEAKVEVESQLFASAAPGQAAIQVGGLRGSTIPEPGNLGWSGAKLTTASYTDLWTKPKAMAGAEFDFPVARPKSDEGCTGKDSCTLTPEQAEANVLGVFFHHTSAGQYYGDSAADNWHETASYLEVLLDDVEYFEKKQCEAPAGQVSVFKQLADANQHILEMAGQTVAAKDVCAVSPKPVPSAKRIGKKK